MLTSVRPLSSLMTSTNAAKGRLAFVTFVAREEKSSILDPFKPPKKVAVRFVEHREKRFRIKPDFELSTLSIIHPGESKCNNKEPVDNYALRGR